MSEFKPGQRWISDTELQLGLATVVAVEPRTVRLEFPATGEQRTYAIQTAPLTRVRIPDGDSIQDRDGNRFTVLSHREDNGLITYAVKNGDGTQGELPEGELSHRIQLSRPTDRLFSGQIDSDKAFELRYLSRVHANRLAHSPIRGLTGGRTSLLPHQLYIAHEVANRFAPRVLLADEVGLGKTIEAGLILHHQLLTERAQRVLIVVPETLVHQWLVEMLRRFNLHFSIFNDDRYNSLKTDDESANPFLSEQLVLCSLGFLMSSEEVFTNALAVGWDLLVVDEAHHLQWSPQQASPEYQVVEALAQATSGVLLLTATPEQLGKDSHFARLRLLDPDRFGDLDRFLKEEQEYEPIANAVDELLNDQPLDDNARELLASTLDEGDNAELLDKLQSSDPAARKPAEQELVNHLLDRHGTGRVLFRNTRATVQGFPERQLVANPMTLPKEYELALAAVADSDDLRAELLLYPDLVYEVTREDISPAWTDIDPRVDWLQQQMKALRPEKILVIAASADTVLDLADKLKTAFGIHAAVFHEGMSIVERDRAAAYFADADKGSQVLICSEIGSEGRNFQFAHHLVLFDLPLNPDLLEQRIGRLDRIGQTDTIKIHTPYFKHSAQAVMQRWYHEGLDAFEHTCPAGHSVFVDVEAELVAALRNPDGANLDELIEKSNQRYQRLIEALHNGRDKLLELNSCRPEVAEKLKDTGLTNDRDDSLPDYLDRVFDQYGVDSDYHSPHCLVLHPSDHVQASFPGLTEDGMTITFSRDIALTNEDMQFLTWEHPLATWSLDLVLTGELGNSAFTIIKDERFKPGTLMLECLYVLESASTEALQALRYLPPTLLRVVTDAQGRDLSTPLTHELISQRLGDVDAATASQIVRGQADTLKQVLDKANALADKLATGAVDEAHRQTRDSLQGEINRLRALRRVNPNVRDEEIQFFEYQWQALNEVIDSAQPRLDAVRVVVAT